MVYNRNAIRNIYIFSLGALFFSAGIHFYLSSQREKNGIERATKIAGRIFMVTGFCLMLLSIFAKGLFLLADLLSNGNSNHPSQDNPLPRASGQTLFSSPAPLLINQAVDSTESDISVMPILPTASI